MADFVQTMKDWRRMCKTVGGESCNGCKLHIAGNDCIAVYEGEMDYAQAEKAITEWAAEHTEPVYPTWGEWFVEHGDLVDGWQNATNAAWMANTAVSIFMKHIPADIAQKLGLQPKEG